jgi:hypothetical protein
MTSWNAATSMYSRTWTTVLIVLLVPAVRTAGKPVSWGLIGPFHLDPGVPGSESCSVPFPSWANTCVRPGE